MPDNQPMAQPPPDQPHAARRHWISVLARADAVAIAELLGTSGGIPEYRRLRGPDAGLVMVRGRTGGGGAAFNLGEMTVTRCTVRTDAGFVGHAYVAGRDERQAEMAALADALLQDPTRQRRLLATLIEPLAATQQCGRDATAAKAAATRVQFFAMRNMRA
jgi:alpha-D-ribose 1-methylphosphonate 5-triphosphate synthase subunit PhnG